MMTDDDDDADDEYLKQLVVKLGKTKKINWVIEDGEQDAYVKSVHCHSRNCKAPGNPRLNDIALIRLKEPVRMRYFDSLKP